MEGETSQRPQFGFGGTSQGFFDNLAKKQELSAKETPKET